MREWLVGIVATVLTGTVVKELTGVLDRLPHAVVAHGVRALPEEERAAKLREFDAELTWLGGSWLLAVLKASGVWVGIRRTPRMRRREARGGRRPAWILGALLIAAWYVVTYGVLEPYRRFVLPPPHEVVAAGALDPVYRTDLLVSLRAMVWITSLGLGLAALAGITVGGLLGVRGRKRSMPGSGPAVAHGAPAAVLIPLICFPTVFLLVPDPSVAGIVLIAAAAFAPMLKVGRLLAGRHREGLAHGIRTAATAAAVATVVAGLSTPTDVFGVTQVVTRYRSVAQFDVMYAALLLCLAFVAFPTWLAGRITAVARHRGRTRAALAGGHLGVAVVAAVVVLHAAPLDRMPGPPSADGPSPVRLAAPVGGGSTEVGVAVVGAGTTTTQGYVVLVVSNHLDWSIVVDGDTFRIDDETDPLIVNAGSRLPSGESRTVTAWLDRPFPTVRTDHVLRYGSDRAGSVEFRVLPI